MGVREAVALLDTLTRHRSVTVRNVREYVVEALCRPEVYEGGEAYDALEQRLHRAMEPDRATAAPQVSWESFEYLQQILASVSGRGVGLGAGLVPYDGFSQEAYETTRELLGARGLSYLGIHSRGDSMAPGRRQCAAILAEEEIARWEEPDADGATEQAPLGTGGLLRGPLAMEMMPAPGGIPGGTGAPGDEWDARYRRRPPFEEPGREPGSGFERGVPRWW